MSTHERSRSTDVLILGGGLAGLTLARHLLLETDCRVLLLERRQEIPAHRQKVGESTVQLAGYYLSKVLGLESYLLHEQFMKYNLRFFWDSARGNKGYEDYGQSYIRPFSNIASYQLNRNTLEAEILRRNQEDERFELLTGVEKTKTTLAESDEDHRLEVVRGGAETQIRARWVIDTTGRARLFAKRMGLRQQNPIRHGALFWWVDGLVDVEALTDRSAREIRLDPAKAHLGHLPIWLATNHFMTEGAWFWVIPLRGKTSLGLVYDSNIVPHDEVFSVERATRWVGERFPLFARDLAEREVIDFGGYRDYSHDCQQTLSPRRWAMAGEAGRFSDPLYSPGSDLISIYNTLIVDAIRTKDPQALERKCATYENLMRAMYQAYVPSYDLGYESLGDQEIFSIRYSWELSIYFATYVFPFINDLFVDRRFILAFLRNFGRLGPINLGILTLLRGYYRWKKEHREASPEPVFFDFTEFSTLRAAEKTFYKVGISVEEARRVLADQVENLEEMARFIVAWVVSEVLGDRRILTHRAFVEGIDLRNLEFDVEAMDARWRDVQASEELFDWTFDPRLLERFRTPRKPSEGLQQVVEEVAS